MGIWDRQIGDLEALGVRFSDLEISLLNDNVEGEALHLSYLYDPTSYDGDTSHMVDKDGVPVLVAEIITVGAANDEVNYYPGDRQPLWSYMDRVYGSLKEPYPSYFGILDTDAGGYLSYESDMRAEDPRPYPFWTCLPLDEANSQAAYRLVKASDRRIGATPYDALIFCCDTEQGSDYCVSAADVYRWSVLHQPMDEDDKQCLKGWLEMYVDRRTREQVVFEVGLAYQYCMENGMAPDPSKPDGAYTYAGLNPAPMEQFLEPGDWLALDMWKSIQARMRFMRSRVARTLGPQAEHRIDQLELL